MPASPPYDPDVRRPTPLASKLAARIRAHGPITTGAYMDACLNDDTFGYYRTQTAIGGDGDFITAPEISQVFGEVIGLWCAVVWQQMGSPARLDLVELGAGRGTLLADALRAARLLPAFRAAITVHILDRNPVLIAAQRATLAGAGVDIIWHETIETLPSRSPALWIGNEFLDTIAAEQDIEIAGAWHPRRIGLDDRGRLCFVGEAELRELPRIRERQSFAWLSAALAQRAATAPLAALFIDYGTATAAPADTMQAVRGHRAEHVLTSPGEADLSVHVDFSAFAASLLDHGRGALAIDGPVSQAEFLGQLGAMERTSKLMAANPAKSNILEMGMARLMAPVGMGGRFKAIGIRSSTLPPLPALNSPAAPAA